METETLISFEKFESMLKMVQSTDKESQGLGLSILEQQDYENNLVAILFATKFSSFDESFWKENAPNARAHLRAIKNVNLQKILTFKAIFDLLVQQKVNPEQMEFFMHFFNKDMLDSMHARGYTFVTDIKTTLKWHQP